jgi:hypothetical protein
LDILNFTISNFGKVEEFSNAGEFSLENFPGLHFPMTKAPPILHSLIIDNFKLFIPEEMFVPAIFQWFFATLFNQI